MHRIDIAYISKDILHIAQNALFPGRQNPPAKQRTPLKVQKFGARSQARPITGGTRRRLDD
jgi:hypothetical protein